MCTTVKPLYVDFSRELGLHSILRSPPHWKTLQLCKKSLFITVKSLFICFLFLHSLFTFNIFSIYDKWYTDVFHKRRYMDIIYKTSQADTKKDLFENFFLQKVVTFFCYFHFFPLNLTWETFPKFLKVP